MIMEQLEQFSQMRYHKGHSSTIARYFIFDELSRIDRLDDSTVSDDMKQMYATINKLSMEGDGPESIQQVPNSVIKQFMFDGMSMFYDKYTSSGFKRIELGHAETIKVSATTMNMLNALAQTEYKQFVKTGVQDLEAAVINVIFDLTTLHEYQDINTYSHVPIDLIKKFIQKFGYARNNGTSSVSIDTDENTYRLDGALGKLCVLLTIDNWRNEEELQLDIESASNDRIASLESFTWLSHTETCISISESMKAEQLSGVDIFTVMNYLARKDSIEDSFIPVSEKQPGSTVEIILQLWLD